MHVQAGNFPGSGLVHLCSAAKSLCTGSALQHVVLISPRKITCLDCLRKMDRTPRWWYSRAGTEIYWVCPTCDQTVKAESGDIRSEFIVECHEFYVHSVGSKPIWFLI